MLNVLRVEGQKVHSLRMFPGLVHMTKNQRQRTQTKGQDRRDTIVNEISVGLTPLPIVATL